MKLPGPDHPISIVVNPKRVRVTLGGAVVADSTRALRLQEASYPSVLYIPRADANMTLLTRTGTSTHCPYKGDASYYTVEAGVRTAKDAVWSYETPFPAMSEINGHLAFYPSRVDGIEEIEA